MVDTTRYFKNKAAVSASSKSNENTGEQWDSESCTAVARKLAKKCIDHYEGSHKSMSSSMGTLYHGALGARVYLRLRMAQHLKSLKNTEKEATPKIRNSSRSPHDSEINTLLKEAWKVAVAAVEIETERAQRHGVRVTLLEGPLVGAKAMLAALLYQTGDEVKAREEANELLGVLEQVTRSMDPEECDVLYGRAGALSAILFLRQELQDMSFGSVLATSIAQSIVENGVQTAVANRSIDARQLPLLWQWHGKSYLGAAHGVVGILHTLLCLSSSERGQISVGGQKGKLDSLIEQSILGLDSLCWAETGNLRSSIESSSREDKLVHWCHGGPGHVLLLVKAWEAFQDVSYLNKAKKIGENVIWPRGLLRKGVGLCHGISGNAYAMLSLEGRSTKSDSGEEKKKTNNSEDESVDPRLWMKRACYYAAFSLENWAELGPVPDEPYSVYMGAGGLALLMMDVGSLNHQFTVDNEASMRRAHFPLYDF